MFFCRKQLDMDRCLKAIEHVEEIWELIGKDEDFSNLVKDEISDALERAG